jgi:hypothetical protein
MSDEGRSPYSNSPAGENEMMNCFVPVSFWSTGGQSRADTSREQSQVKQPKENAGWILPFSQDGRFYRGRFQVPAAGMLVVEFASPRPLKVWFGDLLVVDENLYRYSFQREVRGIALCPCKTGELEITVEVGQRPVHLPFVDEHCPSRNRAKVMEALALQFPDRLEVKARVERDVTCAAASLRFLPTQYIENGEVFQHILVRYADASAGEPPSIDLWSTSDRPAAAMTLMTGTGELLRCGASSQEQRVGMQRFYLPVGTLDNPEPPLRTVATDSRTEPRLETVGDIPLSIAGIGGDISLQVPVYERLGRNAPQREYDPMRWPEYADVKDKLPKPVLPEGMRHFSELYDEAWRMLFRLVRHPLKESGIVQPYISTGTNFTHKQFVWDTSFTAMCTAYACRAMPVDSSMNLLYGGQSDGGYIHRERDTRDGMPILYEPDFSPNPPILSVAEWAMACVTGDRARLRQVYPLLVGYHQWLEANRRLPDGTFWTTGLANGLDNSPSLGEGYPCLTAQMAHDAETLGKIAETIGEEEEAKCWQLRYQEIATVLNGNLWDESMGFYSTSLPGGGFNRNKVVTGFWPLWAGAVPKDRVESLARHLKDPASFWRHHPIPSLAADSLHFVPEGQYWLGSAWAPTNYAAIKGFDRSGRHDLAVETTVRHLQRMWEVYRDTGFIWENYSSEASKNGSWSMHDYCWSALGPIALLIEVLLGIQVDALHNRVIWTPPAEQEAGIADLPVGQATISLLQKQVGGKWCIEVKTDRAFTLEVLSGEIPMRVHCEVGHSEMEVRQS